MLLKSLIAIFFLSFFNDCLAQQAMSNFEKLKKAYPTFVKQLKDNKLQFTDNSTITFDDKTIKNSKELLNNPAVNDMFFFTYSDFKSEKKSDAGRIRNDVFFRKMYGNSKKEVEDNLIFVTWCPKLVNQKILITRINDVHKKVEMISAEIDENPDLKKYVSRIGGTFNWRKIAGSNRMSMHSFGMTIDINVSFSDYWQWQCNCTDEDKPLKYKNQIPEKLVKIFEKNGFIWGGNWTHFDTMHFEYRPELLIN